jgi:hypothetical protein
MTSADVSPLDRDLHRAPAAQSHLGALALIRFDEDEDSDEE